MKFDQDTNLSQEAQHFLNYLSDGDLESVKTVVKRSPSILSDPAIELLYGSSLLFVMNSIQKKATENKAYNAHQRDLFEIARYLVQEDGLDLFAKDENGRSIFSGFNFDEKSDFFSLMCNRKELQVTSKDLSSYEFSQNQKYIYTPDSGRIFNINYQDEDGKTLAHHLFHRIYFDGVLDLFLKREDMDASLSDNLGNVYFEEEIFPLTLGEKAYFFKNPNNLKGLMTLMERAKNKFHLNIEGCSFYADFPLLKMLKGAPEQEKNKVLKDFVSLYRTHEGKTNHIMAIDILDHISQNSGNLSPEEKEAYKHLFNSQDSEGNSLLHVIIKYTQEEDLVSIIESAAGIGADLNIQNNEGDTVWHLIASVGKLDPFQKGLSSLSSKYNRLPKNKYGETAEDVYNSFLANSSKTTAKIYENLNTQAVTFLLRKHKLSLIKEELNEIEEKFKIKKEKKIEWEKKLSEKQKILEQKRENFKDNIKKKKNQSFFSKYFSIVSDVIAKIFRKIFSYVNGLFSSAKIVVSPNSVVAKSVPKVLISTNPKPPSILTGTDSKGNTLLHGMLMDDKILARILSECNGDPTKRALAIKERREHLLILSKELVEYGIDATKANDDGDTAMGLAAKTEFVDLFDSFSSTKGRKNGTKKEGNLDTKVR